LPADHHIAIAIARLPGRPALRQGEMVHPQEEPT
jgi:hypothetical protein